MLVVSSPIATLFAPRGVLLYAPYSLLVLAKGLVALAHRTRLWVFFAAILVLIHPLSVLHYKSGHHEYPTDYKALAEKWGPEIENSDLVFVRRHDPITTPIFYYLKADRYRFVGSNYAEEIDKHPDSRVWFLYAPGHPLTPEMEEALAGYYVEDTIDAFRIQAVLYRKQNGATFRRRDDLDLSWRLSDKEPMWQ